MATRDHPAAFGGEVVVYKCLDGKARVDVRFDQESVWLTQGQMADVLQSTPEKVLVHLSKAFSGKELDAEANTKDFLLVRPEGRKSVRRSVRHYNLNAINSIGRKVNSKRAAHFCQWATRTLRERPVSGHKRNDRMRSERGVHQARQSLELPARMPEKQAFAGDAASATAQIIAAYVDTWRLLLEYDEDRLEVPSGTKPATSAIAHEAALLAIGALRRVLAEKGEASPLFGRPRGDSLEAILGNIEQTMFGKPLYRSREEKAANLLYFVVKDHPFTDGNKRIGALLFLLYLTQEGIKRRPDPGALTALTLLIAESAPSNKELMIRFTVNLMDRFSD
ncbi:MAG: virulence RhuM family protein [Rhodobacteraceae bacterium]|nr:virulence RhuM family protein [Paracoccaceae bacterium]